MSINVEMCVVHLRNTSDKIEKRNAVPSEQKTKTTVLCVRQSVGVRMFNDDTKKIPLDANYLLSRIKY